MIDNNEDKNKFRDKLEEIGKELEKLKKSNPNSILEEFRNDYNDILRDYTYNEMNEEKLEELSKKIKSYKERILSDNSSENSNSKSLSDILSANSSDKQKNEEENNIQKLQIKETEGNLESVQNEITKNQDDFEHFDIDQAKDLLKSAIEDINKDLNEQENIIEEESEINIDDIEIKRTPKFRRFLIKIVPTDVLLGAVALVSKTQDTLESAKEKAEDLKGLVKRKRLNFVKSFKEKLEKEQKETEERELEGMNRIKARRSFGHVDLIYLSIILMLLIFIIGIMIVQ